VRHVFIVGCGDSPVERSGIDGGGIKSGLLRDGWRALDGLGTARASYKLDTCVGIFVSSDRVDCGHHMMKMMNKRATGRAHLTGYPVPLGQKRHAQPSLSCG
jgi:hypothetical protein